MATYYVKSTGSDAAAGTSDATAWATIAKVNATGFSPGDTIRFNGGDRFSDAVLSITSSGTSGNPITVNSYGSGNAILSGGVTVTGWTQVDATKNIWRATFAAATGRPRALWVGRYRCVRAKTYTGLPSGTTDTTDGYSTASSSTPGYLSGYGNKADIEFVFRKEWTEKRIAVASVSGNTITMASGAWANLKADYTPKGWARIVTWVENAYEIFQANAVPGTFYHDRTAGYLYLIPPRRYADPNTATVIAPVREQVVSQSGQSDITLTGLTLSHTTWLAPSDAEGFGDIQAQARNNGGVFNANDAFLKPETAATLTNCTRVKILRCTLTALGTAAIGVGGTSASCEIAGNVLGDISGNGIQVGDPANYTTGTCPTNTSVHNNLIRFVGQEYHGACGIVVWYAATSTITHNTLHDLPYTAISIGWGWGREVPNGNLNNTVSYNKIYESVRLLNDGAGVYSNSVGVGRSITNNWIYRLGKSGNNNTPSLYLDDGSRYITASGNVAHEVLGGRFIVAHNNIGDNTITSTTADSGTITVLTGPFTGTGGANTFDAPNAVGLASAGTAGAALGAGLESGYADVQAADTPYGDFGPFVRSRSGLVMQLRLGEASGTTGSNSVIDASGNANHGTPTSVTFGTYGLIQGDSDTAATFNGSTSYVNVPNASSLNPTTALTLEAWIKTSTLGAGTQIISKDNSGGNARSYGLSYSALAGDGTLAMSVFKSGDSESLITCPVNIADGERHHVAGTYQYVTDGTSIAKLYVDGALVATKTNCVGPLQSTSTAVQIGHRPYSGNPGWFNGIIDEANIYNVALTATQIADNADAGDGIFDPVTVSAAIPSAGDSLNLTFSTAVTGVSASDYSLPGYTLGTVTGSGTSWSLAVSPAVIGGATLTYSYSGTATKAANSIRLPAFTERMVSNESTETNPVSDLRAQRKKERAQQRLMLLIRKKRLQLKQRRRRRR